MNSKCFKNVFSKRLGCLVAVGEHASSQGKANGAASGQLAGFAGSYWLSTVLHFVGVLTASCALANLAWAGVLATNALPTTGQVVQGSAAINQSGAVMNITQSTNKAVVNWNTFDIGTGAKVNIVQPDAGAIMLNRVTSANPSQILGQLNANGQVVLVNPNGILFGKDGSVNANSFTASTLGITDASFMAGNQQFERNGSTAAVVNQGNIKTTGGYVALLGASVSNEGKIETQGGAAYLAAAETVKIPVSGSGRIKLELSPSRINAAVANAKGGTIVTDGGQVYMQAAALNSAVASILQSGSIDTTGEQGGAVHLLADGGQIKVDGSITANSTNVRKKGGDIVIGRDEETGVLAQATDVSGAKLEGQQGFIETSGEWLATSGTIVKAKNWLLDPTNITIAAASPTGDAYTANYTPTADSTILASDIVGSLNAGTSVTIQTSAAGASAGDITVNADIVKSAGSSASLTLNAHRDVLLNNSIKTTSNNLDISLTAVAGKVTGAGGLAAGVGGVISISSATDGELSGIIESGALLKSGAGQTKLSAVSGATYSTNTFAGGITISQGTVLLGNGGGQYNKTAGAGSITLGDVNTGSSNVALLLEKGKDSSQDSGKLTRAIVITSNGTGTTTLGGVVGSAGGQGWTAFGGPVALNKNINFSDGTGDRTSLDGLVSGTGNITLTSGRAIMSSTVLNTFSGDYVVNSGTTLQLNSALALSANNNLVNNGTTRLNGGTTLAINALTGAGTLTSMNLGSGSATTLSMGNNNGSGTYSGTLTETGVFLSVVKNGSGTQIWTGANTYTGSTTISAGTLQVGNGSTVGTLGTGAVSVAAGANLSFYRSNALTPGNAISGAGALNFLGTGVQGQSDYALSGNNASFSGTINLSSSRLQVSNPSQVGTAGIVVNSGAGLSYTHSSLTLTNALSLAGNGWNESTGYLGALRFQNGATVGSAITLTADARIGAHNDNGKVSGVISGAFNLEINTPAGYTNSLVYLTNTSTYTGSTTVNIGTLSVGNGGASGSLGATTGVTLTGGATLAFNKNVNTTIDKSVSGNGNVTANITGNLALTSNVSLTGTNTINLTASGAITETAGSLAATHLYMTTTAGDVGATVNRIQTNVTNLSVSAGGNAYLTEANAVNVAGRTTANNGSLDIATTNGSLTVTAVNGLTGITTNGTGNVTITGNTSTGIGVYLGNNITASGGDITIRGTTASTVNPEAGVKSAATVSGKNITVVASATATTGAVLGYYGAGGVFSASEQLTLTGTSNNSGNGFYTFTGSFSSSTGMSITGSSVSGQGVGLDNNITLTNGNSGGISITGTATVASQQAIGLRGTAITNGGGNTTLTATNGVIFTSGGNVGAWGGVARTNTMTNNGTGTVQVTAGNNSTGNSGSIDGSVFTITQNGNAGVVVSTSGMGNLTAPNVINAGTGNVVLAAGSAIAAGTGTGGQVLTVAGNTVAQNNIAPGQTLIYTGAVAATGVLSNLTSGLSSLYYQGASHPINAAFNQPYGATVAGGAATQVLFRESSAPGFNLDLSTFSATKTYGQTDPAVLAAIQTALGGTSLTRVVAGVGGNNTFAVAGSDVSATLAGSRAAGDNASSTPYAYSFSAGLNTTITAQPTLTINKATLSIALQGIVQKEYDGSTAVSGLSNASYNVSGWVTTGGVTEGATVNQPVAVYTSASVTANTGTGLVTATLQPNNFVLNSGTNLNNYAFPTSVTGNVGLITRAPLTIKVNDTAMFVTQDPNTAADKLIAYTGLKNGETAVSVLGALTRTYTGAANPAAGSYTGVYGLTTSPSAANYTVYLVPGNLAVARADQLLLNVGSTSATYGAVTASNAGASATVVTAQYCLVSTDCNGANIANLTMNNQGAGRWTATDTSSSTISFNTVVDTTARISGAGFVNAGNYTYATSDLVTTGTVNFNGSVVSGGVLTVDPKALTLNASNVTKVYDGTTSVAGMPLGLTGSLTGDQVSVTSSGGTFGGKNAGSQSFSLTGLQLQGADSANYMFTANSVTGTGTITPKTLALSASAVDKAYDGNTSASVGALSVSGAIAGDTVSATGGSASFSDKNVARDASGRVVAKSVTISGVTLTGADAANYQSDTGASVTATITPLTVNASVTAQNKVYDGTTQAQVSGTVTGTLGSDAVSVTSSSSTFASKNVVRDAAGQPTSQSVNVAGLTLAGVDAFNYNLASTTASSTATITPKVLSASGAVADKVYDGTAQASLTGLNGSGLVAGDAVNVQASSAAFSDKNVARDASGNVIAKTVTVTGLSINGTDANNYALMGSSFKAQASILPRSLNVVATAQDKVYDGTTAATGGVSANNIVNGDALQLSWNPGQFASKDVNRNAQGQVQGQAVSFGNVQMAGADVGNYSLSGNIASTTATINPKVLQTIGTVVADKTEDGNTTAQVTMGTWVGLVGAEQLTATVSGSFDSATVGANKPVLVSYSLQDGLGGGRASNYKAASHELKASIMPMAKGNPVQPIVLPVKPLGGDSKVVIVKAQAAVATQPLTSQNEPNPQCSVIRLDPCECRDVELGGVEICIVPRDRMSQTDTPKVSSVSVD